MKAAILISGLRGLFYASLEMARRLKAAGNEVIFASSADLDEQLRPYGYSFTKLPPMKIDESPKEGYEKIFRDAVKELESDTYIIDIECPVYIITAFSLKKRIFILNHFLPLPTKADAPIPNLNISPGEGFWGSTWMIPLGYRLKRLKHYVKSEREKFRQKGKDRRSLLINLASDFGMSKSEYLFSRSISPGPYLYFSNIPILHITAQKLDFQHYLRPQEYYVGPMVFLDRKDNLSGDSSQNLKNLILQIKESGKPMIYCALSSLKAVREDFINKVIDAYNDQDVEVIVGLGRQSEIPKRSIPNNIHFFKWVEAQLVLPYADLAVITAGFHTIHECLYFEVPMISFSFSTTDQNGFQARIRTKKLGLNGDFEKETPDSLLQKTTYLLQSGEHKAALKKMKEHLNDYLDKQTFEKLTELVKSS